MEGTPISSSMIRSVGYDRDSSTLEVEFNKGGVYQFGDVPLGEFEGLMSASSHGKYFLANVKGRYPTLKL